MLQKSTVTGATYTLLVQLMDDTNFKDFYLVGGTSIALRIGHRTSIDLDLFTQKDFDINELRTHLAQNYNFQSSFESKNTLKGFIDGVFIDCITYNYPFIRPIETYDNNRIRMLSLEDIVAMKLSAITDNGTRVKDFVDIAYLSTKFSLNDMLSFYEKKYTGTTILSPLKALLYFSDIDFETEEVQLLNNSFNWKKIKTRLEAMAHNPEFVFPDFP